MSKDANPSAASQADAMFSHLLASRPQRSARATVAATLVSAASHGVVVAGLLWATMAVGSEISKAEDDVTIIEVPPALDIPPPPPPPSEPVMTPTSDVKGFQTIAVPDFIPVDIPPPAVGSLIREEDFAGVGVRGGKGDGKVTGETDAVVDIASAPQFTPFTVAPRIVNQADVVRALERDYPPLLRDAGIGGSVTVWFFIDEDGTVLKRQIDQSSGYDALDQAALKVADIMRFTPAYNRDRKVQVWVSLPIRFATR